MIVYLFMVGRAILGGYFIYNGYSHFKNKETMTGYAASKNLPFPKASIVLSGAMMILGGAGILLGFFVGVSVFLLVLFLAGTLYRVHRYWEVTDPAVRMSEHINFYKNLALIGALFMILSVPSPWVLSLSALFY